MVFIASGENTEATKKNIPTFLKEKAQEKVGKERSSRMGKRKKM